MEQAFTEAEKAARSGEIPVGAIIIQRNTLISTGRNRMMEYNDPTAHAEMEAIRSACRLFGQPYLTDCDLYVTLEPCTMCAGAISCVRLRRLYYAASDRKGGGVEHGSAYFSQNTCHHKPEIYAGFSARRSQILLKSFFQSCRREKSSFTFLPPTPQRSDQGVSRDTKLK